MRLDRRTFLFSSLAFAVRLRAPQRVPSMRIVRIDTTYWKTREAAPWWPHCWVRVHADSGHVGIGESYPRSEVEAAMVHSYVARMLLGRDPRDRWSSWRTWPASQSRPSWGGDGARGRAAPTLRRNIRVRAGIHRGRGGQTVRARNGLRLALGRQLIGEISCKTDPMIPSFRRQAGKPSHDANAGNQSVLHRRQPLLASTAFSSSPMVVT